MNEPHAIIVLDEIELALRLAEAATQERRLPGLDSLAALNAAMPDPRLRHGWLRAARAALLYFVERTQLAQEEATHEDHPLRSREPETSSRH